MIVMKTTTMTRFILIALSIGPNFESFPNHKEKRLSHPHVHVIALDRLSPYQAKKTELWVSEVHRK